MRKLISRVLPLVLVLVLAVGCLSAMAAETPALPSATITEVQNDDLTFAMNFRADIVTDEQLAYYGSWYADFVLTFSEPVTLNANGGADGYLSGQYDKWSENWVNVPFKDVTLQAGESLKIMEYASELMGKPGLKYTYKEVYESVKDFDCGVFLENDYILNNPDTVITLELRIFNNENEAESYRVGDLYEFRFNFVARNTATGKIYEDVSDALQAAQDGQTVELLKDAADDMVSVFENTTLDLAGHTLTATYVSSFGDTVDSSADNSGVLAAKHLMIQPDNEQVTVKTAKGFQFFEVLSFLSAYEAANERFCFVPEFEAAARELLAPGAATTGVTVQVDVSWLTADGHTRTQLFQFSDEFVKGFLASYNPSTDWYSKMFILTLKNTADFNDLTFEASVFSDTGVRVSENDFNEVETSGNVVTADTTITHENGSALVPAGTVLDEGATALVLSATEMDESQSNVTLSDGETMLSMDVCVEGVSKENTTPIIVTLNEVTAEGLNIGNIALYHVENGVTTEMTRVFSIEEVDEHNEYYYDIETGTITMALASFSEVAMRTVNANPWNGEIDTGWYNDTDTTFEIFNADQLAGLGKLVDGGNTFAGKTVRLMLDVKLSDGSHSDTACISFNPIGFGYAYDTTNGKAFMGTFDGNGNIVYGLYQNCWQMGADTYTYSTAGGGLFASVNNATIKNLTMDNAYIVMECIDMGTVVGYAQGNCTFENLVVKNSTLANYQRYTGGAIGEVSNGHHILKNVDVEASTIVSSLWGDFDASLGGIIGGKWGHNNNYVTGQDGHKVSVYMENCDVAAKINAYNDVTSAYQWYSYRRCGMLIGHTEESKTDNGRTEATASYLKTVNCTVQYGDWVNYTYCRFSNTTSKDARYPWVRVQGSEFNGAYSNPRYGVPVVNGAAFDVTSHTFERDHVAADEGYHDVLIKFNQLYGGGQGCYGGNSHVGDGVTVIGPNDTHLTSAVKFESTGLTNITTGSTVKLGELFKATGNGMAIQGAYVYAFVSPTNETDTVRGSQVVPTADGKWEDLTITFTGTGKATIIISDYNFCTPTVLHVEVTYPKATVTTAPSPIELTYNTKEQSLVNGGSSTEGTIVYSLTEDGEYSTTIPSGLDAGTYTVYYKVLGDDIHSDSDPQSVTVSVAQATPVVTVVPVQNLTYNSENKSLVTSETTGGTIWYKVVEKVATRSSDGYSTEIPVFTKAGTFTVYYKVVGDKNYKDVAEQSVEVTVAKADPEYTAPSAITGLTYTGEAQTLITAGSSGHGSFSYSLDANGPFTATVTATTAGTYTVYWKLTGDGNHNDASGSFTVTIAQAEPKYTIPNNLTAPVGTALSAIDLDNGFSWTNPDEKVSLEKAEYEATYTPSDSNYKTVTVNIPVEVTKRDPIKKFEVVLNNGDFLHRVGNQNTVKLGSLFKAIDGAEIGTVSVTVETINGASGTYTAKTPWTDGTIQFSGTGVVKVTIKDDDTYCTPTELLLEVVDATNVTGLSGTVSGNVVLLNDCGLSSLTVSGRNTVYGNGFTATYTADGRYLNSGLKQGVVTVSENGTLDNLRIKATIYPKAYLYYGTTPVGDYVQDGPSSQEGEKIRYHYQLSAVVAKGNATIDGCYIYGGRNNIFIDTGDVTVKDSVLECGTVANVQIQSNASHTVTFENVTTIQHQVNPTIGETSEDTSLVMLGAGILVGPETTENPTIVLNGEFKQYNWVTADDVNAVSNDMAKIVIQGALDATAYNHTVDGKTASNLGIVYMNTYDAIVENNTGLPYELDTVAMTYANNTINGQVCSLQNATAEQIYSDIENADKSTENPYYEPQFKYSADLGGQYIENTDEGDEHCYRDGDTIYVMFPSGDTKELDLAALVDITKYTGQDLGMVITVKDSNGNAVTVTDGKITLSAIEEYTVTYKVTDTVFYDKDGQSVTETKSYSWDVTVSVSLKDTAVPDAYFEFDNTKQKMGYYKPFIGDVKQYLPFLAGLKIYDYIGQTSYQRFDGDADFNKVASVTITGYTSNEAYIEVKLTDGGVINTKFLARADSGGGSTYTGSIKTSNNVIYFVNGGGTSNTESTTTAAYWYVDYYKFTGNNGVTIQSAQQTFNSTGSSASTPSDAFSTTIKYTVTYDANEGNCGQATGYATSASDAVTLPTPTRSGYLCSGWYTAASGGTRVGGAGESYTPAADITLYAQWGKPSTVTYDANGGSCDTTSEKYTGTALTLPTATRDDYWFVGWYDAAEGGNKIGEAGAAYNPKGDITLYAHWQEKVEYTVTYNPNGGTCDTASATYQGTALTLPTPTLTGYKFLGWYTAASDGTKIGNAGASYTPEANVTMYAQWEKIAYTITVTTSNATVTDVTDGQTAYYGDTISVTVSFSGSNSKTLKVTDASNNTILSKSAAGTYTFTMPASNVTISASSSSCVTPDTLVTLADGTQKQIQYITDSDMLMVWDHFTGNYTAVPAAIIFDHGYGDNTVIQLNFSDGTTLKVVNLHQLLNADQSKYVTISAETVAQYVGSRFVKRSGEGYTTVTLDSYSITQEYIEAYGIISALHYNILVEDMISTDFMEEDYPLFNYFQLGSDLKYDADKMAADIEAYGLYTYEDFAGYMTEEQFDAFNVQYMKISVGKGVYTFQQILNLINEYLN